jgi:hypothetical protein
MRIVAFSGPKYSGKDTAAECLFKLNTRYNLFRLAKMAEGVKNVCAEMFGYTTEQMEDPLLKETKTETYPFIEHRWPMMDIANFLRDKYGGDVHCKRWERVAQEADAHWSCHVMTDLRFPEELEMLQRLKALIIYVHRQEAEDALSAKQGAGDAMALNPSEAHYKLLRENATAIVYNDGTIEQLHGQIQNLVSERFGHWNFWPNKVESVLHQMRTGKFSDA